MVGDVVYGYDTAYHGVSLFSYQSILGQELMDTDAPSHTPRPRHFLWAGVIAMAFLGAAILILPEPHSTSRLQESEQSEPRQHVLVLVVDSTDQVDAHGEHVHSVIRQYCGACEVRQINVNGNMSPARLLLALEQALEIVRDVGQTTSTIINLSWGIYAYHESMHDKIRELYALGAVIVASAGNDNTSKPFYPAAFDEVFGICSSSRYRKTKAAYSNFGPWVSLCAPGLHYVSRPLQHGGIASGTSFASPMVTGALGQHLLEAPCATTEQGLQALLRTADPWPEEGSQPMTAGRVNLEAAAHYLTTLYACGAQPGLGARFLRTLRHASSNVALLIGLVIYALVSIFAFPFLFAYIIERFRLRSEEQLYTAICMAYTESTSYRSQRMNMLRERFCRTRRFRPRVRTELLALLHAQFVFEELCGWCEGQQLMLANEPESIFRGKLQSDDERLWVCARCGLKPGTSTLCLER